MYQRCRAPGTPSWIGWSTATAIYLNAQAAAGAQALQVFDSWVGTLSPRDYARFVQPHMARLFARLDPIVPVIHFGTGTASLLELQRDAGGSVIGLDWRVELDRSLAAAGAGSCRAGQPRSRGVAGFPRRDRAPGPAVLAQAAGRPGHIFNLGHGILQETPVDNVRFLVDLVHAASLRGVSG